VAEVEVVDHSVMVWAKADEVFWRVVLFVFVDMMKVDDFVESADDALFGNFSVGLEVNVVRFSGVVGFVLVKVENVIVAAGTEAFCVDCHFSFASFAFLNLGFPV